MNTLNVVDLANFENPSKIVELTETQSIRVEGVPYDALMRCFRDNIEYLDKALKGEAEAVTELLENQPQIVARLIAEACGDTSDKAVAVARKMATFYQAKLITAIFEVTFPDAEALGKFMGEVEVLLKTMVVASAQQKMMIASGALQPSRSNT